MKCCKAQSSHLDVFKDMQGDPVKGIANEGQAHIGCGVVEITNQIHGVLAAFGPKLNIQFLGSSNLVRGGICYWYTGGKKTRLLFTWLKIH